ncbi:MAG: Unknown protein [uncultured Sulfurovum sp.]|uniref:Uncharacterized protein n=1 Tax=uncultured Sulfurovum sp. TaxID=269237 RepID=A0A6S6TKG8_9BACT|nr:MAG: Unknown protein [uncultured Sulfurovum sp.]
MDKNLKICIKIDDNVIYEFAGDIDKPTMINAANEIEALLLEKSLEKDKVKNVFELFIETAQNIRNYSYQTIETANGSNGTFCNFSLAYCTLSDTYVLESCNLIKERQQKVIEQKIDAIKGLDCKALRKLVRQKSRSAEDRHDKGAGLGYIMMARKSSAPMEVAFSPYKKGILMYKQKLFI